jgi:hypothetical protein
MKTLLGLLLVAGLAACGRAPDPAPPKKLDQAEVAFIAQTYLKEHHPEIDLKTTGILPMQFVQETDHWDISLTRIPQPDPADSQKEPTTARFLEPGFTLRVKRDGTVVETKE